MAAKGPVPVKAPGLGKHPHLEVTKKKKSKKRKAGKGDKGADKSDKALTAMAMSILDEIGRCPISMEPMRRPVLPSSGQAYDEINIVRYCNSGNKRCPVSGGPLKVSKHGKVLHTVDFALRKLIITQAANAKLILPSTDKDTLFRELRESSLPETAKAIVDDCYLGYIRFADLQQLLEELSSGRSADGRAGCTAAAFTAILAECFACRNVDMIDLATEYLKGYECAWNDQRVLQEAMAVGQDPDCRRQVLVVLEEKVKRRAYGPPQIRTFLQFETESVPVHQFQARVGELVLRHGGKGLHIKACESLMVPIINLALRVREDLDGCLDEGLEKCDVWYLALEALKNLNATLDDANLDRLFWRDKRMVLRQLANSHDSLLLWHLSQHKSALSLCVACIAGNGPLAAFDDPEAVYTSEEEDYFSEDEDGTMEDADIELLSSYSRRPDPSGNYPAISNLINVAERRARRSA